MNKAAINTLLEDVAGVRDCALVHEAALMVWGLDNNLTPYAIDVLVSKKTYNRLAESRPSCAAEYMGNQYVEIGNAYAPIRAWNSVGDGLTFASSRLVACDNLDYKCLRPELVLEALPTSPDYQYLLEQRAALAEVLFFDEMTDEQLMEFRSFVRCV